MSVKTVTDKSTAAKFNFYFAALQEMCRSLLGDHDSIEDARQEAVVLHGALMRQAAHLTCSTYLQRPKTPEECSQIIGEVQENLQAGLDAWLNTMPRDENGLFIYQPKQQPGPIKQAPSIDPEELMTPLPPELQAAVAKCRDAISRPISALVHDEPTAIAMLSVLLHEAAWMAAIAYLKRDANGKGQEIIDSIHVNLTEGLAVWLESLPIDASTGKRIFQT